MGRIKRGTRYVFRRRRGHGARRFLDTDRHAPAAHGRHRPEPSTRARLVSLALPPLIISFLGLCFLDRAVRAPASIAIGVKFLLFFSMTIVFAVRALTASRTPLWIRLTGFAATLPFPIGLVLIATGVWAGPERESTRPYVYRPWHPASERGLLRPAARADLKDDLHVQGLAIAPGGERFAAVAHSLCLWDMETGRWIRCLDTRVKDRDDPFNNVAIDPRGRWVATGKARPLGALGIWDAKTGRELRVVAEHARRIVDLVFDAEGRRLVTTDGTEVRLWDCTRWTSRRIPHHRGVSTHDLALGPEGRYVYALTRRGVERWDLDGGERWAPVVEEAAAHYRMAIAPDGGRIFIAGDRGEVRVYDIATGAVARVLQGRHRHADPASGLRDDSVTGLALSPDGRRLYAATACEVTLWDAGTLLPVDRIRVYSSHRTASPSRRIECLAATNDRLLVGCVIGTLIYENVAP